MDNYDGIVKQKHMLCSRHASLRGVSRAHWPSCNFVAPWRNTLSLPAKFVAGDDTDSAVGAWRVAEQVSGRRPIFPGGLRQRISQALKGCTWRLAVCGRLFHSALTGVAHSPLGTGAVLYFAGLVCPVLMWDLQQEAKETTSRYGQHQQGDLFP